jgi:beta-alanine--pyruvate transaminase
MGAVVAGNHVYDAVVEQGPAGIELFHGYTYSGHPLAAAAGLAALGVYEKDGLFDRAKAMSGPFGDAAHALKGHRNVIDIRNLGLVAGIEFAPRPGAPGARGMEIFHRCFDEGLMVRAAADVIALSPPLILEQTHIDEMFGKLAKVIAAVD